MEYSKIIKKLREKAFFTQTELATILGVSFTTVNRWEKGKFSPSMKMKKKLQVLFEEYRIIEGNTKY